MRVLVVDDEPAVRQALDRALRFEGYETEMAGDGLGALSAIAERPADAVVLDVAMPRVDGLEVCRRMRNAGDRTPVLMLTARDAIDDRVHGLDAGADDYLVKPFAFAELSARVRALLRRGAREDTRLRVADLEMDTATRQVKRGGRLIDLKLKEYALLEFLLTHANRPVTRTMITEHVWDIHFDSVSNVVEVHINSLRNKLDKGFAVTLIHTVRGVGYMMADSPQ